MKLDFKSFKNMPASQLQDITPEKNGPAAGNPDNGASASHGPQSAQSAQPADDIFDTGIHTETAQETSNNTGSATGVPKTPGTKSVSELTAGKAGKFGTDLLNILLPAALVFILNRAGYKIDKKLYKLSADERDAITPAMQAVMDTIFIDLNNPYAQLALVIGIVYGAKTMDAIPEMKKIVKDMPDAADVIETITQPGEKPETFEEAYERELSSMAKAAAKKRKKGYDEAYAFVSKAEGKALEMKLRKKFAS